MRFGGKTILKFCLYGLLLLALAGCGSGGGGGGSDTSAPTAPGSLTANAISSSQINLQWGASSDDTGVAGYKVYRDGSLLASSVGDSSAIQDASLIDETITTTTYTDPTVQGNTNYCYRVTAYDAANNESTHSNQACTTTPGSADTTAPTAPTGLTANAISSTQINLSWNASSDATGVTGYKVYRDGSLLASSIGTSSVDSYSSSSDDADGDGVTDDGVIVTEDVSLIGETITLTTYSDMSPEADTSYCYRVTAYDAANNESAFSNEDCDTTPVALACGNSTSGYTLEISDLILPSIVTNWPSYESGSVAYTGDFASISTPVMATRLYETGERRMYYTSPYMYTFACRIYFRVLFPDTITGWEYTDFRIVDYVDHGSWTSGAESNILSQWANISD